MHATLSRDEGSGFGETPKSSRHAKEAKMPLLNKRETEQVHGMALGQARPT
jgi:hypothetical protein